jgi:hypothetical protein
MTTQHTAPDKALTLHPLEENGPDALDTHDIPHLAKRNQRKLVRIGASTEAAGLGTRRHSVHLGRRITTNAAFPSPPYFDADTTCQPSDAALLMFCSNVSMTRPPTTLYSQCAVCGAVQHPLIASKPTTGAMSFSVFIRFKHSECGLVPPNAPYRFSEVVHRMGRGPWPSGAAYLQFAALDLLDSVKATLSHYRRWSL